MSYMFSGCNALKAIDLSKFNTKNVTDMRYMFYKCNLENIDLSSFDTTSVTNMSYMFSGCYNLKNIDLSKFNAMNVTDMSYMFFNCNLKTIDFTGFKTKKY